MLPVIQGRLGLVNAIRDLTHLGYVVSVPLIDNQDYDLIVDIDGILNKVSVKSSSVFTEDKVLVQIKKVRPNTQNNKITRFDSSLVDYMYIYSLNNKSWFIPTSEIKTGCMITLDKRFDDYKLDGLSELA